MTIQQLIAENIHFDDNDLAHCTEPFLVELLTTLLNELKGEIEAMRIKKPHCYCREYTLHPHDCGVTSNAALADAAALITSKIEGK